MEYKSGLLLEGANAAPQHVRVMRPIARMARSRPGRHHGRRLALALFGLHLPLCANADWIFAPYVSEQYRFDSNIFAVADSAQAIAETGGTQRSDQILISQAGVSTSYRLGREVLRAKIEGRRLLYQHFSYLDNNQYLLGGGFDWKLFTIADGALDFSQERRLVAYQDRADAARAMELDRMVTASANVLIDPEWRVDLGARTHKLDTPIVGYPQFSLLETGGNAGISYIGVSHLSTGFEFSFLHGQYSGITDTPGYDNYTGSGKLVYQISGLSSASASVGYTSFQSPGAANNSAQGLSLGITGTRKISGKTDVNLGLFRRTESFTAGADVVVDTGVDVGVHWQATTSVLVTSDYAWTYSTYHALGNVAAVGTGRGDHSKFVTFALDYAFRDWLVLRGYGTYDDRTSNIELDRFNEAQIGAQIRILFGTQ